ncbi:sigma-54-dependent Fis family transcriptional regulator [Sinimarinibacterium flocculans]|uniref:sigma-54-dependent Fis family transcriptional regulator n=1 Tax=Sinimarinibacterium flocculans TaxID=985250 RepID=UPI0024932873|nr:sigma-54-dependent Fis family transcriptional regulator [Sinimarinibacterium flocculans]
MRPSQHHVDAVLNIVDSGLPTTVDDEAQLIYRSWIRCFNDYGLHPARRQRLAVESTTRLRERREHHEACLQAARTGMEQLYGHFADLGYVVMLADTQGVTLDCIGSADSDSPLRAALVAGANWNETLAGTNGIGTCLAEARTITCHRQDHYYASNLDLSCTATPLHDPNGQLMGALDVSALAAPDARESQHLARHLTQLYGRMIEDANFIQHFRDRWILKLSSRPALVDVHAELMLAFDGDGVIVGANSGARRRLQVLERTVRGNLVGNSLAAVFRSAADVWKLARGADAGDRARLDTWEGTPFHATVRAPRRTVRPAVAAVQAADTRPLDALGGGDPQMARLVEQARLLCGRPINILIHGETGTGKEVLARALHEASPRADKPFIAVNCAAIPESLIESELFGYQPGTFTGARSKGMVGLIQRADGGTLFLDEIGDMPLALQTRLLRVLSEGEVLPLGADKPVPLSLTVVSASHRNLRELVAQRGFREDLYYRLCGAPLQLPPLRERRDRAELIGRLAAEEAQALGTDTRIAPQAFDLMVRYDWPGNIRELRNALRYALSLAGSSGVEIRDLPPQIIDAAARSEPPLMALPAPEQKAGDAPRTGTGSGASPECEHLLGVLRRHHWNITQVSKELRLCRATVYRRMKRFGIVPPTQFS